MKELWVKKTIWRRYLIDDENVRDTKAILNNKQMATMEIVENWYDKNKKVEYDNENTILPVEYEIKDFEQNP